LSPAGEEGAKLSTDGGDDEEHLDLDEVDEDEDGHKKIANNKLKRINDWRLIHDGSWWSALKAGDLRPNDKRILISFILSFVFWVILLTLLLVFGSGLTGSVSCVPIIYIGVCVILATAVIGDSRPFTPKELILWIVMLLIYLANGIVFLWFNYNISTFTIDVSKSSAE
jgi:hypothetical protein